ncbi:MAG: alpha/beta hydrolase [Alphaproteobacteria bacterium]|nr:alpha/beta hydrolase [Alphaproteobacteria bacterium SS10]
MATYQRGSAELLSPSEAFTLVFHEWLPDDGAVQGDPIFCVHGLTRNGRDFDPLAKALADRGRRVICPDVAGRGESDWLTNHDEYNNPIYGQHLMGLLAHLGLGQVDWIGTSMGGLIGMGIASLGPVPIKRLIINDVGPVVTATSLNRIGDYVGRDLSFESVGALEQHLRVIHAPFGDLSDEEWAHLAKYSARIDGDRYRLAYDPAIAKAFEVKIEDDMALWPIWDAIQSPTMVIRGGVSDLLTSDVAEQMTVRGPRAKLFEVPGVGHAPALMDPAQISAIIEWLNV